MFLFMTTTDSFSKMIWIPPGSFYMGSDHTNAKTDEKPRHLVQLDGFWIDETPVTNKQFKVFVDATGYITTAEKAPILEEIMRQVPPGTSLPNSDLLIPSSLVFKQTKLIMQLFGGNGNQGLIGAIL